jgi:pilus assembly protein Flp/PilA
LGQTQPDEQLSDAAGGRAAGRLAARFDLTRALLRRFHDNERGATAIEYGLICALVFLVIVTSVTSFGNHTSNIMKNIATAISAATG